MIDKAEKIYSDGKKNLELLLREKAYSEVKQNLKNKGIAIDTIDDEDIENLVAAKVQDMKNSIKGFGVGAVLTLAISILTGI